MARSLACVDASQAHQFFGDLALAPISLSTPPWAGAFFAAPDVDHIRWGQIE